MNTNILYKNKTGKSEVGKHNLSVFFSSGIALATVERLSASAVKKPESVGTKSEAPSNATN